jgi:hypothetical protein
MSKKGLGDLISVLLLVVVGLAIVVILGVAIQKWTHSSLGPSKPQSVKIITPACSDGRDNDRDGYIDYPDDPECASPTDNDEATVDQQDVPYTNSTGATGPSQLDATATCTNLRIEPLKCSFLYILPGSGTPYDRQTLIYVQGRRTEGAGAIKGLRFIFENTAGKIKLLDIDKTSTIRSFILPGELDYFTITFNVSGNISSSISKVNIAPKISQGEQFCQPLFNPISCIIPNAEALPADIDNGNGLGVCDGGVDINDLLYFLAQFQSNSLGADIWPAPEGDGAVTLEDLQAFLKGFEAGISSC